MASVGDRSPAQAGVSGDETPGRERPPPSRGRGFMRRFAKWHIWLGWLTGVPLVLWCVSGLVMVARPIEEVRGDHLRRELGPVALPAGTDIAIRLPADPARPVVSAATRVEEGRVITRLAYADESVERFDESGYSRRLLQNFCFARGGVHRVRERRNRGLVLDDRGLVLENELLERRVLIGVCDERRLHQFGVGHHRLRFGNRRIFFDRRRCLARHLWLRGDRLWNRLGRDWFRCNWFLGNWFLRDRFL